MSWFSSSQSMVGSLRHGLSDDLGGRLAVDVEEGLVIELVDLDHGRVEPDRVDDPQVVGLLLGNVPARTASRTPWAIAACTVPMRMFVYVRP